MDRWGVVLYASLGTFLEPFKSFDLSGEQPPTKSVGHPSFLGEAKVTTTTDVCPVPLVVVLPFVSSSRVSLGCHCGVVCSGRVAFRLPFFCCRWRWSSV